jgi:transposase-like protein
LIKIGSKFAWLWVAIEDPMNKQVIHIDISFERTMLIVAERFIVASLINKFGNHSVSTADGGIWYPQACHFLKLKHHLHIPLLRKVSSKEQCNMSRIELNIALMTIFLAKEKRNVN